MDAPLADLRLAAALVDGARLPANLDGEPAAEVSLVQAGTLDVRDGRLVAADPFADPDRSAFRNVDVPPGRHPVVLGRALGVNAVAALLVGDPADVVRYELGLIGEQDVDHLVEDEHFGYPVDAGTGCFATADATRALAEDDGEALLDAFDGDWLDLRASFGLDAVLFRSGDGDGAYPTYAAYDVQDRLVAVVTDFAVLDLGGPRWPAEPRKPLPPPPPDRRPRWQQRLGAIDDWFEERRMERARRRSGSSEPGRRAG